MTWWLLVSLSRNADVLAVAEADHTHAAVSEARMWTCIVSVFVEAFPEKATILSKIGLSGR